MKSITLRVKGTKKTRNFEPEHAKRLLALPNTQWEEIKTAKNNVERKSSERTHKQSDK